MKGIILAGGVGKRLYPITKVTNKHLLPVYKKPMIYYPLETMLGAGIKDILLVVGSEHAGDFLKLLGSGREWNARFTYEVQEGSGGTAEALNLAKDFVDNEDFLVILGDNILVEPIKKFVEGFRKRKNKFKAKILLAKVKHPEKYGVVTIKKGKILEISEKPKHPKSNYAVTGLYMFTSEVFDKIKKIKKSPRGEYELTDILAQYLNEGSLDYDILGMEWTDAGSFEALVDATNLMKKFESEGKLK